MKHVTLHFGARVLALLGIEKNFRFNFFFLRRWKTQALSYRNITDNAIVEKSSSQNDPPGEAIDMASPT